MVNNLINQIIELNDNYFFIDIIVIIDGSTDGTYENLVKKNKLHLIIGDSTWWYTKCINKGIKYSKSLNPDFILTFNDDIILDNLFFQNLYFDINVLPSNSFLGALSIISKPYPQIITSGVKKINWWRSKYITYHKMFEKVELDTLNGLKKSKVLPGRAMLFPYNVLDSIGGFDENFAQYHSDFDFCLRASKKGFRIFISWDLRIISYIDKTASGTSYLKTPFTTFLKGFIDNHSRIYIIDFIRFNFRHGIKLLLPINIIIFFLATFYSYFYKKKITD